MDTLKTINNMNNINFNFTQDSTLVKKENTTDCFYVKDIFIAYAWPILILIIFIVLKKKLIVLINALNCLITRIIEVKYNGISLKTSKADFDKSELPESPESVEDFSPEGLLKIYMIKKILSTLWNYQKEKDSSERWTFTLSVYNSEYEDFVSAIKKLTKFGLVAQLKESQQFFLTDYGIFYCRKKEKELSKDIFTF